MKTINIPSQLTIAELKELYDMKVVSPQEVIEAIIKRAEQDKEMNIWITPPTMELIQPYLDRLEKVDSGTLPLWGIPFAIKDNIDLVGVPTTAGCEEFSYTPEKNAFVVEHLIEAGAIPVGKTNLDQFATGLVGTRSPYGETHNALNQELISGGSSSGSAVAVARGQAAFSLGTDTAGSGRVPAALNHLVGYKPSLGAWSTSGVVPACASIDCITVFANHLDDALSVDSIVRISNEQDPWSRNILKPVRKLPEKICIPETGLAFFGPYAKEYQEAWESTVAKLSKLNIPIEYVDIEVYMEAAALLYGGPFVAERWAGLGGFIEAKPNVTFPVTEEVLRSGSATEYDAASVFHAMHKLQSYKFDVRKMLKNSVLVMPTAGGTWTREQVRENPIHTNSQMGLYTNHCNLLDLCAVAVPAEKISENTPFGITLFALAENEGLICGAADLFLGGDSKKSLELEETDTTLVAVCGLHMRGYPLEKQMKECGASFVREALTAEKYQFVKLPTVPAKPGLLKKEVGGKSIEIEIWEMPLTEFGKFTASIPAPLGIGKVELLNGEEIPGFICEGYVELRAEDITEARGWRNI